MPSSAGDLVLVVVGHRDAEAGREVLVEGEVDHHVDRVGAPRAAASSPSVGPSTQLAVGVGLGTTAVVDDVAPRRRHLGVGARRATPRSA